LGDKLLLPIFEGLEYTKWDETIISGRGLIFFLLFLRA